LYLVKFSKSIKKPLFGGSLVKWFSSGELSIPYSILLFGFSSPEEEGLVFPYELVSFEASS